MEVPGRTQTVTEGRDDLILCTPCAGVNEEERACFYCIVCNEHLCELCGRAHRRAKMSKDHELLNEDDMPKCQLPTIEENFCHKHNTKLLEYYCNTHDCFCCSACFALDHQGCCLKYLEDLAVGIQESDEYLTVSQEIANVIGLLEEVSVGKREKILEKHSELVASVKNFKSEITKGVDKLERASLAQLESLKDFYLRQDLKSTSKSKATLADIREFSKRMEDLKRYKQYRQLVVIFNKASEKVLEGRARLEDISVEDDIVQYKIEPNRRSLCQNLKLLKGLGTLKKVPKKTDPEDGAIKTRSERKRHINFVTQTKSYATVVNEWRIAAGFKTETSLESINDLANNLLNIEMVDNGADDRFDECFSDQYDEHYKKFDHRKTIRKWKKKCKAK